MWYSGHTTVLILETMLSQASTRSGQPGASLSLRVNHEDAGVVRLPDDLSVAAPNDVDVTRFVKAGDNSLELATSNGNLISAQFVSDSYVPWQDAPATAPQSDSNASSFLKYSVSYATTKPTTADEVACRVHAERVGFRGYGMMLAEVGIPPGAEVDRESLERSLQERSGPDRYDVLPDRVIFYLWPSAGGSDFTFQFRPRFAMQAETAPSLLYDYYNPDAAVTVQPTRFDVSATGPGS
jgi:hypothetical protein